jgi:hypothetical protein
VADIRQPDLFDPERLARENAKLRAEVGMTRAATKAERVSDGWNERALEAVRQFALEHETFLAEDVRKLCPTPAGADGRAWGAVIQAAKRNGWIRAGGAASALSSNGSLKVLWKSNVYEPKKAS